MFLQEINDIFYRTVYHEQRPCFYELNSEHGININVLKIIPTPNIIYSIYIFFFFLRTKPRHERTQFTREKWKELDEN